MIELKYGAAMLIATLFIAMPLYIPIGIKKDNALTAFCILGAFIEWLLIWYISLGFMW